MSEENDWRSKVDELLSSLRADNRALAQAVDTMVSRLGHIEKKLETVASGPNISQWSGWGAFIGGAVWLLVTQNIQSVENQFNATMKSQIQLSERLIGYVENLDDENNEHDVMIARLDERIGKNVEDIAFQWEYSENRYENIKARERERATDLDERIAERFSRNEVIIERNRSGREDDNNMARDSAIADKDELERAAQTDLRRSVERLETAVGHLRAAFSDNLPGGDD